MLWVYHGQLRIWTLDFFQLASDVLGHADRRVRIYHNIRIDDPLMLANSTCGQS